MIVTFKCFLAIDLKQNLKYFEKVQSFSLDASKICHVQEYIYEHITLYLNITELCKAKAKLNCAKAKVETFNETEIR